MFEPFATLSQLLLSSKLSDRFGATSRPAELASSWSNGQVLNSSYLSPYFTQSRDNIDRYTDYSIQSLVTGVNHTSGQFLDGDPNPVGNLFFWQSQNGWTGVSRWDHLRNKRDHFINVLTAQNGLARYPNDGFQQWGVPLVNTYNDDAGWAAMSNLEAYEAYGHPIFLERAIGVWEFISSHGYINQSVLDQGYLKGVKFPNNTLQTECNGKTMLGGVYWRNGGDPPEDREILNAANQPSVNAVSTGNYGLLGAELCRVTGDASYCDRAYQNVWWMDNHMVDPQTNLLWDHYNASSCVLVNHTFTYNIGLYIGIYAELGYLTNNDTATSLAEKAIVAALNTDAWNTPEGINMEGQGEAGLSGDVIGFKSIMIRYLQKAYFWIKDEDIKAAIVQYINIQYYAITHYAADSDMMPIRYGRNWTGPAFNLSSQHAQVAALDVLTGLKLNPDSAFPSGGDASSPVISVSNGTR